jgi:hypothetical protein
VVTREAKKRYGSCPLWEIDELIGRVDEFMREGNGIAFAVNARANSPSKRAR